MPLAHDILALDLLTLADHTRAAGDRLDPDTHLAAIERSLAVSRACVVRGREGPDDDALVAYALLHPQDEARHDWFVTGFGTHPAHRNAGVMRRLMGAVSAVLAEEGVRVLRSHVYRTNALSLAFHRRLGFEVTRENDKAVEFTRAIGPEARVAAWRDGGGTR